MWMFLPTWLLAITIHKIWCKHCISSSSSSSNKPAIICRNCSALYLFKRSDYLQKVLEQHVWHCLRQRVLLNCFFAFISVCFFLFSSWLKCIKVRPEYRSACRLLSLCRLFGVTGNCAACSKLIPAFEMVMRARDNVYHLDCFACQLCRQR